MVPEWVKRESGLIPLQPPLLYVGMKSDKPLYYEKAGE
jgi:hypothetical protein